MLVAAAEPSRADHAFDVHRFARQAFILEDGECERLSLSDGQSRIRVDLLAGSFLDGPVALRFEIADDRRAPSQIMAFTRFRALRQRGLFGHWLNQPERHARRWIDQLRTYDALNASASERDIAETLFPARYDIDDWRYGGNSLRSTVRRLIISAKRMVGGGYRELLR